MLALNRFLTIFSTLLVLAGASTSTVAAEPYPNKPIRMVVPFGPGGGADIPSRRVAQELSKVLGQSVVVDNRQGAGGIVAVDLAAKAPADGYTVVVGTISTHSLNPGLYKNLPYDPIRSFVPVSRIAAFSNVLVVPSSLGITNMKQLIDLASRSSKPLTFASPGTGTTMHLQGEVFQRVTGVKLLHVPYADMGQYVTDLIAGRTNMTFGSLMQVLQYVKNGKLIPIAITSPQRSSLLPDVPTMAEVGLESMEMAPWLAIFAPAGTPPNVVEKLNKAVNTVLQMDAVKDAFAADGTAPVADRSSAEFAAFLRDDVARWTKAIEEAGIPKQ